MAKVTVKVKMFADPIEVDDSELVDLAAQGLLDEDDKTAHARRHESLSRPADVDPPYRAKDAKLDMSGIPDTDQPELD